VQHKLLRVRVVRRRGLQPAHEGAVPQLGLRVRPDQAQAQRLGQPLGLLVRRRLRQQRRDEHLPQRAAEPVSVAPQGPRPGPAALHPLTRLLSP